jgi:ubiquinone/menaquinone biosynthesis C-methylase UbiE
MIVVWITLAGLGVAALLFWQLVIAEGTYLGPRVVAWTYDLVASRYDRVKQFAARDEVWFLAQPIIKSVSGVHSPAVLDVATGTGRLPLALMQASFQGQVVGLDLSKEMLRLAVQKLGEFGERVSFVWQDAMNLPFADGSFEVVTCLEALEFMPRPVDALAEMVRVLAPGGVLVITNRVGLEAFLLPGRALPRAKFRRALAAFPLHQIDVRRWQVQYDLATARKHTGSLKRA